MIKFAKPGDFRLVPVVSLAGTWVTDESSSKLCVVSFVVDEGHAKIVMDVAGMASLVATLSALLHVKDHGESPETLSLTQRLNEALATAEAAGFRRGRICAHEDTRRDIVWATMGVLSTAPAGDEELLGYPLVVDNEVPAGFVRFQWGVGFPYAVQIRVQGSAQEDGE